jgi:hypothetical protein
LSTWQAAYALRGHRRTVEIPLPSYVQRTAILAIHGRDTARDRLLIGRRDASNALLPEEKHAVAVHEAGHALVAML